ncbi:MAG TPA: hypothetical protein VLN90_00605 [Thioalkalivibrio sp.]|nr:hypothetical protein [Thioalkalivibrio sp.]
MSVGESSCLHLVIPGLLDRLADWQASYGTVGRYPHLEWLLARARPQIGEDLGPEATLSALFGLSGPVPAGALRRLSLTGEQDRGPWMCMDPVHLEPGITDLVLSGPAGLHLGPDEARGLVSRLNAHLSQDGLNIEATAPGHWHVRLPGDSPMPQTHTLGQVLGRPINALLPAGPGAAVWHQRFNELQMVLYDAPENQARETRGLPTVNSIWPWGAGLLPQGVRTPASRVYGDDLLLAGLARCAGITPDALPESAETVLKTAGTRLVYLDPLLQDAAGDDLEGWQASMEGLERAWFRPLRRALGTSRLKGLVIHGCRGGVFTLAASARWQFWKKSHPLPELMT